VIIARPRISQDIACDHPWARVFGVVVRSRGSAANIRAGRLLEAGRKFMNTPLEEGAGHAAMTACRQCRRLRTTTPKTWPRVVTRDVLRYSRSWR